MNLRSLVEKTPDADVLRDMIGFATEPMMLSTAALCSRFGIWRRERGIAGQPLTGKAD
jgi:hypothetical protein